MLNQNIRTLHIIVEGITDKKLLSQFIRCEELRIKPVFGWENVVDVVNLANSERLNNVLGLIDSDYHLFCNSGHVCGSISNLIYTDKHDIEMMLFLSSALDKFIAVNMKVDSTPKPDDYRSRIAGIARPIGTLRLINIERTLGLIFKDIEHADFINRNLVLNKCELVRLLYARTRSKRKCTPAMNEKELLSAVEDERYSAINSFDICNGHDVLNIMAISMRKEYATWPSEMSKAEHIFDDLLLAYSQEEFENTTLFRTIATWIKQQQSSLKKESKPAC